MEFWQSCKAIDLFHSIQIFPWSKFPLFTARIVKRAKIMFSQASVCPNETWDQVTTPPSPQDYVQAGGMHPTGMHSCFAPVYMYTLCNWLFSLNASRTWTNYHSMRAVFKQETHSTITDSIPSSICTPITYCKKVMNMICIKFFTCVIHPQ